MAINLNRPFINNTGLDKDNCLINLIQDISPELENETTTLEHSRYCSDVDFQEVLQYTHGEMVILNLNCQNLGTKFDKLKLFLSKVNTNKNITCITLQETWFDKNTELSLYNIPGYNLVSDPHRISTHGGIAMYIHDDFIYERKDLSNTSPVFENLSLEIIRKNSHGTKYLISSIYRPPAGLVANLSLFIDQFTEFLNNVGNIYQRAYISGDTNINLLKINENAYYNSFFENVTTQGFMPQITLPTRLCDTCDTLIDNTFTNNFDKEHKNGILTSIISDHNMTFCILVGTCNKTQSNIKQCVEIENVSERSLENFRIELLNKNMFDNMNHDLFADPNQNCEILSTIITNAKNLHMPLKIRKFNKCKDKKEKWMTNGLLLQINRKNKMYVDWKTKSLNEEIYNMKKINFKTYDRIINRNIVEAKKNYYNNSFRIHKNDMKNTWKTINETLGRIKGNNSLPTSITHDNTTVTDPTEIANVFNNYFINIGVKLASAIDNNNDYSTYKQYLIRPAGSNCTMEKVTETDVIAHINKMKNKSSSGYDGISNKMLKYVKNEISKVLALVINQMLETGIFPKILKISKVIPLYKKGDPLLISNYRPISLLPTISKVFERVIYDQLYTYFNTNDLLAKQQFGFRAKHSTDLAAIQLTDYIRYEMDQMKTPVNIYIDLSKAFDTINYDILLYKLRYYGVNGSSLQLIKSYLSNRKQYVQYGSKNHKSNMMLINTGVPQGSILGPLLFSIYINDIVTVSSKLHFLMYADDTTIYFNREDFSIEHLISEVNLELNKVNIWLKKNMLSLNVEKTKCITFHSWQRQVNPAVFSINEVYIENVRDFKFLGIILNENLTWKSHVDMISSRLSKVICILRKLRYIYPQEALLSIYNSLFASHINYAISLWGTNSDKLFGLQKKAMRLITNNAYLSHTEPLFKMLGILKIEDLYRLKLLKFYYNLCYGNLPLYFDVYIDVIDYVIPHTYSLRSDARSLIRLPRIRHVFAESGILYQLIIIINKTHEENPDILLKIKDKSHEFSGFSKYVITKYLESYKCECTLRYCYTCGRI